MLDKDDKAAASTDRFNMEAHLDLVAKALRETSEVNIVNCSRCSYVVFHPKPKHEDYCISATS